MGNRRLAAIVGRTGVERGHQSGSDMAAREDHCFVLYIFLFLRLVLLLYSCPSPQSWDGGGLAISWRGGGLVVLGSGSEVRPLLDIHLLFKP
jgi:hypothetical protein